MVQAHAGAGIDTKLFKSEVEYLGHKISKGGVEMIPEYVRKVTNWPIPTSGKEVAMFVGFAGCYQNFIPQYSALTNRLNGIKKAEKFVWNGEIEQDFVQLKEAFTKGGIQAFPDFGVGAPLVLTTHWSQEKNFKFRTEKRDSWDAGEGSAINTRGIIPVTKGNCWQ